MNALTAPLLHVQRSDALWLIPTVPVVGALARAAIVDLDDPEEPASKKLGAALAPSAVALLLVASQLFGLVSLDESSRLLISPGFSPLRVGTFELGLGLCLDPAAAVVALAITALGLALQTKDVRRAPAIDLAVAGALLAVLGDGFFGLLLGGAVASFGAAWASTDDAQATRSFFVPRVSDLALVIAAVLLFWSLGGSWGITLDNEPNYTRHNPAPANVSTLDALDSDELDPAPALHAVLVGSAPPPATSASPKGAAVDPSAKGAITLALAPGSKLFLKGASESAGNTPIVRHEVYAGRIDVEVERPNGKRVRFRALEVPAGREVAIVPVGPTASFRELRDELALEDATHQKFVRNLLDPAVGWHRRIGPVHVPHALAALVALAGLGWVVAAVLAEDALLAGLAGLLGVYLLSRLSMLVALSPQASGGAAVAAAVLSLACAVGAARHVEARKLVTHLLGALLSLAALAVLLGSPSLGLLHAVISVAACGLLDALLARRAPDLARASDLASSAPRSAALLRAMSFAVAGAPVPFLGAAFGTFAILDRAAAVELPFARAAFAFGALAAALLSFAAQRACFLVTDGPARKRPLEELPAGLANAFFGGVGAVLLLGPALGVSRTFLGIMGGERSVFEGFVDVGVAPMVVLGADKAARLESGRAVDLGLTVLALAGAFAAWFWARKTYGTDERDKPVAPSGEPAARALAPLLAFTGFIARLDELLFSFGGSKEER